MSPWRCGNVGHATVTRAQRNQNINETGEKKKKLKWNEDKRKWAHMTKITTPTVKKRRTESKVGRWGGETEDNVHSTSHQKTEH